MRPTSPTSISRRAAIAALTVSVALLATGCSASAGGTTGGSSDASQKATIDYGVWDQSFVPGYQKLLPAFHKLHPNITVKFQVTPFQDYFTKLNTTISSKSEPDVYWLQNNSFDLYAKKGVLAPLSSAVKSNKVDLSGYAKTVLDQFTQNGELYALPWSAITVGLWYDKDLFQKAGVPAPTSSWTWSDVQSAAAKLTDKKAGTYGIAAPLYSQENFYNTIYQAGGSVLQNGKARINSPEAVQGIKFWSDFIAKGQSPTLQQMTDTAPDAMFQSGKVAMLYGGSWHAGTFAANAAIAKKIDVAPLPAGHQKVVDLATAVNVVSKNSKHLDAAQAWATFLATDAAQKSQASGGIVVPASTHARAEWEKSLPDFHVGVFLDQLAYAQPMPSSLDTSAWEALAVPALSPLWEGKVDAQQAADDYAKQIDTKLAAEKNL